MAISPADSCRNITFFSPGILNQDPNLIGGYQLSCVNTIVSQFIGGEPQNMIGLSDGGYAFLGQEANRVTVTRIYCGSPPPHRSPIKLTIYADVDQNCTINNLDTPLVNFPIKVGDETYFTDSKGQISRTILALSLIHI